MSGEVAMSAFTLPTDPLFFTAGHLQTAVSLALLLSQLTLLLVGREGRVNLDEMWESMSWRLIKEGWVWQEEECMYAD